VVDAPLGTSDRAGPTDWVEIGKAVRPGPPPVPTVIESDPVRFPGGVTAARAGVVVRFVPPD
jgi:hypothetical protein